MPAGKLVISHCALRSVFVGAADMDAPPGLQPVEKPSGPPLASRQERSAADRISASACPADRAGGQAGHPEPHRALLEPRGWQIRIAAFRPRCARAGSRPPRPCRCSTWNVRTHDRRADLFASPITIPTGAGAGGRTLALAHRAAAFDPARIEDVPRTTLPPPARTACCRGPEPVRGESHPDPAAGPHPPPAQLSVGQPRPDDPRRRPHGRPCIATLHPKRSMTMPTARPWTAWPAIIRT